MDRPSAPADVLPDPSSTLLTLLAGMCLWWAGIGLTTTTRLLADLIPGTGTFESPSAVAAISAMMITTGLVSAIALCAK